MALDRDHDQGAGDEQELRHMRVGGRGGIERKRRHDPDGDCRHRKREHGIGRGAIGRAIGEHRAAELDHIGDERGDERPWLPPKHGGWITSARAAAYPRTRAASIETIC